MQLSLNVFFPLLLVSAAAAQEIEIGFVDEDDKSDPKCDVLRKLETVTSMAGNETLLQEVFDHNQTVIDAFKANAERKKSDLDKLKSNATLVESCNAAWAVEDEIDDCHEMWFTEKMIKLESNQTRMEQVFKGDQSRIDQFKQRVEEAKPELSKFQNNATLTAFCSVEHDKEACKFRKMAEKMTELANNQTFLKEDLQGNEALIDRFKKQAAKLQSKLDASRGNSTLDSFCDREAQEGGVSASSTNGTNGTNGGPHPARTSGAGIAQTAGSVLSVGLVLALGMTLL